MFRKTLMLLVVVVSGCGVDDSGSGGAKKSSLPENYGHGCLTNADCSDVAGASCNGSSGRMCIVACTTDAQCGSGTVCVPGNGCSQTCKVDSDCVNGSGCIYSDELKSSFCGYPPQTPIGGHCKQSYECTTYDCRTNTKHPNGYCTESCTSSAECGANGICVLASASATAGSCAPRCASPGSRSSCTNESMCRVLENSSDGYCD